MMAYIKTRFPNKRVDAILPEGPTQSMREVFPGLDGMEGLIQMQDGRLPEKRLLPSYALAISLDCANRERMHEAVRPYFDNAQEKAKVDHHEGPDFADYNLVDHEACSTTHIIDRYFVRQKLNGKPNPPLYDAIVGGIVGDTRIWGATTDALRSVTHAIERGARELEKWQSVISHRNTAQLEMTAKIDSNYRYLGKKFASVTVPESLIAQYPELATNRDKLYDAVFDSLSQLSKLEHLGFYAGIVQRPDGNTHLIFRSKSDKIDAAELARSIFNGGGDHERAAAYLKGNPDLEVVRKTIEAEVMKRLNQEQPPLCLIG